MGPGPARLAHRVLGHESGSLGETLDIHGGGLDLQFPHHENELAQSESTTGATFSRVWMHNGLLKMGTAKIGRSVGNVVNIADLLQHHNPETVRFLLLSTHYRSPIEYSEDRLNEVAKSLQSFYRFFDDTSESRERTSMRPKPRCSKNRLNTPSPTRFLKK